MLRGAACTIALVCLSGLLAGCTDNPLPAVTEAQAVAAPGVPTSIGVNASIVGYAGPEHFMVERWENGSYSATDSAWPIGGLVHGTFGDRRAERVFDITSDLPRGVPAMVMIEADATTRGGDWPNGGDIDIGIRANDLDFIGGSWNTPYGGHSEGAVWVQALTGEPIQVVLFYGELDPSVSISYTLRIAIMGSANIIPPAGVAGIHLAHGERLVLEPLGGEPEVSLYDAADVLVGRYSVSKATEIIVPTTAYAGEFVIVNTQGGGMIGVAAIRNDTSPLRAIGFEWVGGAEKPLGAGAVRWTEEAEERVIATGLWVFSGEEPYRCPSVEGTVKGPDGDEVVSATFADVQCIGTAPVMGFGLWAQSLRGENAVREGTYSIEVTARDSLHLTAQEWFLYYVR